LPSLNFTQDVSICEGQSFFAGGALQTTSGVYLDTLTSVFGCDSILTTNLTVTPAITFTQDVSICEGQSFFAGGANQTTSGVYLDTLVSISGCDSVLTTNLTVLPTVNFSQNISICEGQSFFAGGANQTETGIYFDTLISSLGCDSIVTTNLTVLKSSLFQQDVSICEGQSFYAGGANQTISGIYFDTLLNSLGCDSIVTTNLSVLPVLNFTQNVSICEGQSFYAGGADQTASGVYLDTLLSSSGCDSIVTTNLQVVPALYYTQNVAICEGDSFLAGGNFQNQNGVFVDSLLSVFGCDSILTTILTVNPDVSSTLNVSICDGQFYFAGGANQTTSGVYFDTLMAASGCDSLLTTYLVVLQNSSFSQSISICTGDSVFAGGAYQTAAGSYSDTLVNALGCDSVLTTLVSLLPVSSFIQSISICEGDSYYAGGAFQTQSGIYFDTLVNDAGCDSVITTTLTVVPLSLVTVNLSICDGDSVFAGGAWQTQTGVYTDTFTNAAGCDSILTSSLVVFPNSFFSQNITICQGDSVFAGGAYQTQSGIFIDYLQNSFGCDSAVTTNLLVALPAMVALQATICEGDSFYAGGSYQTQPGWYVDSLVTAAGCDSVVTTQIFVLPVLFTQVDTSICEGETFFVAGSGQTTPGIYADTLSAFTGCDSVVIYNLSVNPVPMISLGNDTSFCSGDSILLEAGSGYVSYLWQDNESTESYPAAMAGQYFVTVTNEFGCTGADTMEVTAVNSLPENFLPADTIICGNLPVMIDVPGFENYLWFDGDSTSFKIFTEAGIYLLEAEDENGCRGTDSIRLEDQCTDDLLMPNAFTPNGDGLNDELVPVIIHTMTEYHLKIFDRWGMLVFQSVNPQTGWDGFANGTRGEMGTYVWVVDYTLVSGEKKIASGNVTMLR
jgi:gliding motility-associated-like protein